MNKQQVVEFYAGIKVESRFLRFEANEQFRKEPWVCALFECKITTPKGVMVTPYRAGLACLEVPKVGLDTFNPRTKAPYASLSEMREAGLLVSNHDRAVEHSVRCRALGTEDPNPGLARWVERARGRTPDPVSVIYSLCMDLETAISCVSFTEFCGEFGYDEDSRWAEGVYNAVSESAAKLRRVGFTLELCKFLRFLDYNYNLSFDDAVALYLDEEE